MTRQVLVVFGIPVFLVSLGIKYQVSQLIPAIRDVKKVSVLRVDLVSLTLVVCFVDLIVFVTPIGLCLLLGLFVL